MFKSARQWIHASRWRQVAAVTLGIAMLITGAMLTLNVVTAPAVPDPATASGDRIITFLRDDYHRLGSAQREELIRGLARRLATMNETDRRAFDQRWRDSGLDPRVRRQINAQVWSSFIRQMAGEYTALPAEQRTAYLDRLLTMMRFIDGADGFMDWLDSNPLETAARNPETLSGDLLHWDLSIGTSAEERAELVQLGGDLLKRARQRGMRR